MTTCSLSDKSCEPCQGGLPALTMAEAQAFLSDLGEGWELDRDAQVLIRRFAFKGFAKATYLANLCVWLADKEGHHPDISLGWGYAEVRLTTHEIGGLSENDFVWAAKLDKVLAA